MMVLEGQVEQDLTEEAVKAEREVQDSWSQIVLGNKDSGRRRPVR